MYQKITKQKATAGRCSASAMESETIQKNGASLKSQTSRKNILLWVEI
jgi:hypothetical protein